MAGNDTAVGSALIIPEGLLDKLKHVDEKIKRIQDTSRATANVFNSSFASMSAGLNTGNLLTNLQQVINQLGQVGSAAATASSATLNMGSGLGTAAQGATNLGTSVTGVSEAINRMIGQLQQTGQVGSSSLMAAKLAADKLMEAMQFRNTGNIAALKDEIQNINKTLKDTESALSMSEQQSLVERKRLLQEELKEAERTQNERAVNLQRVLDRMVNANEAYSKKEISVRKSVEKEIQKDNENYLKSLEERARRAQEYQMRIQELESKKKSINSKAQVSVEAEIQKEQTDYLKSLERQAAAEQEYQARMQSLKNKRAEIEASANKAVEAEIKQENDKYLSSLNERIKQEQDYQQRMARLKEKRKEIDKAASASVEAEIKSEKEAYMRSLSERIRQQQEYNQRMAELKAQQAENERKTYKGAMSLGNSATSINERTQAIKYLTEARNALSKTDADYTNKLATLNAKIKELNAANRQAIASSQELNNSHRNLMDTAGQLQRAFALMFSVSQIRDYIGQIAKVRGEFELQQRSLEAILQNKTEADTIFNKTVALAVQSPFQIRELVSYTKQLAAYRIENDKLYNTTKRLADVSAGLGVDMQRLILAYGQVKAAAYLRGSEVRQFTEAGINMYGELQKLFKERDQADYTTAQIVDMISRRQVTFEDVAEVFKRITDQGGIFYRMQEIQAETLQGKIANFKDSVDVMMNEIGKDNEGLFKGAIDSATALLGHWEEIVNVGKALVGVFLLLKTYSLQTGVAMSKVFTANMMANAANTLKFTELLHYGFLNLSKSVKILGANLKAAFVTNLPMLAITALGMAIYETYDRISSYREAVAKSNEELVKARGAVADLTNEYKNLTTATNNAQKVQERNADPAKDIEARRNALQKLIDLSGKNGLTFEIKVSEVKEEELDNVFNGVKEKYERFLLDMAIIQKRHAENKSAKDWWFFSDAINEDANDYKNAVLEVLAQSDKLDTAISNIKTNYDHLSEASKKYYKEIAAGKKDGESEIDYYTRMYNAMLQINRLNVGTNTGVPKWLKATNTILKDISGDFKDICTQAQEFAKELDDVLGDVIENARKRGATDIQIKPLIDKYTAEQGFDDIQKDLAYRHFNIKISIDKDETSKEISWVNNYLTDFFSKRTYSIKFDVTKPTSTDALKDFIKKGDDAAKAAKSWEEASKRIAAVGKNVKQITADSNIATIMNANPLYNIKSGDKVDVKTLKDIIDNYRKVNADIANSLGVNPFEKQAKKSAKAQRDILSEQISLLKEMQERYEKLRKLMSETDAAQNVKTSFADALDYVKMPESIAHNFVPSKEGLIKAYEQLLSTIPDTIENFKKRAEIKKYIAQYELEINEEALKSDIDAAKKKIEAAFSSLDIYTKMKGEGATDSMIDTLFPGLAKSFKDVQKIMDEVYKDKKGGNWVKAREEAEEKLAQKTVDYNRQTVQELMKEFKTQVDDRLKLDLWYAQKRKEIEENIKDEATMTELKTNLDKQYEQRKDELTWKEFKNSNSYIRLFENLDYASTNTLKRIRGRLEEMRTSLSELTPEQLKEIVTQIEKVDEILAARNPFATMSRGLEELANNKAKLDDLYKNLENSEILEKSYQEEVRKQQEIVDSKEEEYKSVRDTNGAQSEQAKKLRDIIQLEKLRLIALKAQLDAQGKNTDEIDEQIRKLENGTKDVKDGFAGIMSYAQKIIGGIQGLASDLESLGIEMPEWASGTLDGLSGMASGLESFAMAKDPVSKVVAGMKIAGSLAKTVGSIFGIGNKDKELQKEIENQQRIVERLERAYNKLKVSMDEAWSAADVIKANKDTKENIEAQIKSYQSMIASERDKKDSNDDTIREWQNKIDDLKEALKELEKQTMEIFGGFGSEANYKSAAQEFADAWVDAFNEAENTLDALNDTFDNYFNNMLKKQLMQRGAQRYLEPLFKAIDDAVYNKETESLRSAEDMKNRLANIGELSETSLEGLDSFFKSLMEIFGVKPGSSAKSSLSKLQQGIQSITEQTANALEALLNSIRFYVSQQTSDISAIRMLLQQANNKGTTVSADTPMLTELRAQTIILQNINSNLERVIRMSGHPKQGAGIKVFMD